MKKKIVKNRFQLYDASYVEYENNITEIEFEKEVFAHVYKESSQDNIEIKIFNNPLNENWSFQLSDLIKVLKKAEKLNES